MISDDALRQAARDWETARLEQSPKPEECCFTASFRFRRSMKRTLRRTDHPVRCQIRRIAACFLLAVLLGGGGMLATSEDARAAFVGWTTRAFDNCFEYTYTGPETPVSSNVVYIPTWLPDGFSFDKKFQRYSGMDYYYKNEENVEILVSYSAYTEGMLLQVGGDDFEVQHIYIGRNDADLYIDHEEGNDNALIWADDEKKVMFEIYAPLSGNELIKIAESISSEQPIYLPTWIPDGYSLVDTFDLLSGMDYYYKNEKKQMITFSYIAYDEGFHLQVEGENCEKLQTHVGKYSADLYIDHDVGHNNALIWTDYQKGLLFQIFAPLSGDELIKMAESISTAQVVYCPTWIPDGFSLVDKFERHSGTEFYYENEAGQVLSFDYSPYHEGFLLQIVGDNLEVLHTKIGKCPADLYIDHKEGENSVLVWTDDEKRLLFQIFAPLGADGLIKMAESVSEQFIPQE